MTLTDEERSVASAGSVAGEPVAWLGKAARTDGGNVIVLRLTRSDAESDVHDQETCEPREVVPLYRSPQPPLTDEEREAVERACDVIDNKTCGDSTTLRKLLERLK